MSMRGFLRSVTVLLVLIVAQPSPAGAVTVTEQSALLAHVLKFRLVGAVDVDRIPGFFPKPAGAGSAFAPVLPGVSDPDAQKALWAHFFRGTQIFQAHMGSATKLVAFYNPVVDAWLLTGWDTSQKPAGLVRAEVVLGDTLRGEAAPRPLPSWMRGEGGRSLLDGLPSQVSKTMERFKAAFPDGATQPPAFGPQGMGSNATLEIFADRLADTYSAVIALETTPAVAGPHRRALDLLGKGDEAGLRELFRGGALSGAIDAVVKVAEPLRKSLLPLFVLETDGRIVVGSANPEQGRVWFLVSFAKGKDGQVTAEGVTSLDPYRDAK